MHKCGGSDIISTVVKLLRRKIKVQGKEREVSMMNRKRFIKSILFPVTAAVLLMTGCAANIGHDSGDDTPGTAPPAPEGQENAAPASESQDAATLLYQGHASIRITTAEGKVIYIDPYAGEGYDLPADLILITHEHSDHNRVELIDSRNPGCEVITEKEALKDGKRRTFDLGYVTVETVEAGNKNHNPTECVGYILTLSDGIKIYISGDTSRTAQMETFAERNLDYAFFCCDGVYNMDMAEASECAKLVGAKCSIPYHMAPGKLFDIERAEQFKADGRLIIAAGEEIAM